MLWFSKKQQASAVPVPANQIVPAELPLALDARLFKQHCTKLLEIVAQDGGIESYLAALRAKQHAFTETLAREPVAATDIETLLGCVFTARRRVYPALERIGMPRAAGLLRDLVAGELPPAERLQAFVDAMPGAAGMDRESVKAAAKVRRAAWDFAAEALHFSDPVRYPLMSRWVWDEATQSGALREFVRGNDAIRDIPFNNSPATFEGARVWLAERIAEEGIYRDVPLWIDLVQAQAYTAYFRSFTEGSLGADFARGVTPHEQLKKLLGIDAAPGTRLRVKKTS
jgi:hypothetical protein